MKKFVFCEGVCESWVTDSQNEEYADEKTPYFDSGPYYLASEADARIAELERALRSCLGVFDHPRFTDRHGMSAMVRKALGL